MYEHAPALPMTLDGLVSQLPFLLLVLAMLWSGASRIRASVAVAALAGLAHALLVAGAPLAAFWCAPASALRPYLETHDEVRHALEHGFATALKSKLRATNRTIAGGGAAAA